MTYHPPCPNHPRLEDWPARNLIEGVCPACGHYVDDGGRRRELVRRQILYERGAWVHTSLPTNDTGRTK